MADLALDITWDDVRKARPRVSRLWMALGMGGLVLGIASSAWIWFYRKPTQVVAPTPRVEEPTRPLHEENGPPVQRDRSYCEQLENAAGSSAIRIGADLRYYCSGF